MLAVLNFTCFFAVKVSKSLNQTQEIAKLPHRTKCNPQKPQVVFFGLPSATLDDVRGYRDGATS